MSSYILRKIDPALWIRVKAKAALEAVSIRVLIERLLTVWVETPAAPVERRPPADPAAVIKAYADQIGGKP